MATDEGRSFASAFDDMLAQSRREFDALLSASGGSATTRPAATDLAVRGDAKRNVDMALQIFGQTESARRLTQRFGDGWRCEVVERQREADEVIALCKLHVPAHNIVRSHFGVASLSATAAGDEDAAYYAAVSEAMQECAASLV